MQTAFHRELAHDRQRQLVRDDGVASQLAAFRANERARLEAERRSSLRFEPRSSMLTVLARRLRSSIHTRPLGT
jgi:hypothetical protein